MDKIQNAGNYLWEHLYSKVKENSSEDVWDDAWVYIGAPIRNRCYEWIYDQVQRQIKITLDKRGLE